MVIVKIYIIVNALVRIQAIEKFDEENAESNHKDTIFNKLYEPIKKIINKQSHLFKLSSHTQKISVLLRKYSRFSTRC